MAQQRVDNDAIYALLLHDIQWGVISGDSYWREADVAERFGVSRTPVRDALNRLVHDGLLVRTPKGLRAREVTPQEIIQVYDARILLESEAAAEAARSRSIADMAMLEGLLRRDQALTDHDDAIRTSTNLEFHAAVWAATHNAVLGDLLDRLSLHLIHYPSSTLSVGARWQESLSEHAAIVRAIDDGDVTAARSLMSAHMTRARDLRLAMFTGGLL